MNLSTILDKKIVNKFIKLSKISFSTEYFSADYSRFSSTNVDYKWMITLDIFFAESILGFLKGKMCVPIKTFSVFSHCHSSNETDRARSSVCEKRDGNICRNWFLIIYIPTSIFLAKKSNAYKHFCNRFRQNTGRNKEENWPRYVFVINRYFYDLGVSRALLKSKNKKSNFYWQPDKFTTITYKLEERGSERLICESSMNSILDVRMGTEYPLHFGFLF